MAEIQITIDLDDLEDVSRQDVIDFLSVHGDELRPDDWADVIGDDLREAITMGYLREQASSTVDNLLEACDYHGNALDSLQYDDLLDYVIKRAFKVLVPVEPEDTAFMRDQLGNRLSRLRTDYAGYLREFLGYRREAKLARAQQSTDLCGNG